MLVKFQGVILGLSSILSWLSSSKNTCSVSVFNLFSYLMMYHFKVYAYTFDNSVSKIRKR